MMTLDQIMTGSPIGLPEHLAADAEVPALDGLQCQGDVAIVPDTMIEWSNQTGPAVSVDGTGIEVVRGEQGGNTHLLTSFDAGVTWLPATRTGGQFLGALVVPEGATAFLLHGEHGANAVAPGRYGLVRQTETTVAGQRLIAD